jgi:hypothetical protein
VEQIPCERRPNGGSPHRQLVRESSTNQVLPQCFSFNHSTFDRSLQSK